MAAAARHALAVPLALAALAAGVDVVPWTPPVVDVAAWTPPPLYNCFVEYEAWEILWTQPWKDYCCEHEGRGCPYTTTLTQTETETSTTATTTTLTGTTTTGTTTTLTLTTTTITETTSVTETTSTTLTETSTSTLTNTTTSVTETTSTQTTSTQTTSTQTTTTVPGCDAQCWTTGLTASCKARINYAATHALHGTKNEVAPCAAAQVLVVSQCDMCGGCSLVDAGCHDKPPSLRFRRKFESGDDVREAPRGWPAFAAGVALALAVGLAALGATGRRWRHHGPWQPLRAQEARGVE